MQNAGNVDDARLIADLNDLLQLDHDAVQAYTVAINLARDAGIRDQLVEFRADHKRHIEELAALVRDRGGLPIELPHPTAPLKLAVQSLGAIASDETLLLAFKAVEGQARDKYRGFARNRYPDDVAQVVSRAASDEETHYDWVESTLSARGVGAGTLPHGIARLVEGVHQAIANPIEGLGRNITEQVGRAVGTTRTRGGSEAPSPRDVAHGMAAGGMRDEEMTEPPVNTDDAPTRDSTRRTGSSRAGPAADDVVVDASVDILGPSGRPARDELGDDLPGGSDRSR